MIWRQSDNLFFANPPIVPAPFPRLLNTLPRADWTLMSVVTVTSAPTEAPASTPLMEYQRRCGSYPRAFATPFRRQTENSRRSYKPEGTLVARRFRHTYRQTGSLLPQALRIRACIVRPAASVPGFFCSRCFEYELTRSVEFDLHQLNNQKSLMGSSRENFSRKKYPAPFPLFPQ